jgi:hypothetical protein
MLCSIRLTALFVMSLIVWAQPTCAAQPRADTPSALYKLEGVVVNAETGRPIPRALVQLFTMGRQAVLTGLEGEFSFDKLAKGTVMIRVEKPGYFEPASRARGFSPQPVEVGPQTGKITLKLEPESAISGAVMSDDGEPLEGVVVEAVLERLVDGRRERTQARGSVRTDEDGLFHLAGLPAGKYFLSVKAGDAGRRILGAQSGNSKHAYPLLVYFPGVAEIASATPFDLAPGQRAHAQFSLSQVPSFTLSGTVSGIQDFKRVSAPMIVDAMEQPVLNANRWDSQTGAFEFPSLPAGAYLLHVYAMLDDNHPAGIRQSMTLSHDVSGFNLPLRVGATIPVSVRTELSAASPQRTCSGGFSSSNGKFLDCIKFPAMVTLAPADSGRMQYQTEGDPADSSSLAFRGVAPGKYRVKATPMIAAYVGSIRCGDADLLRDDLVVPSGGNIPPIEIVLRDDGAKVRVHVQAEHLPEHARILLFSEFAPFEHPLTLDVPLDGNREYGNIAPGDYKVLAFESIDAIEYENPEVLEKYSAKTARITLSAQGTTNVTVELIRDGE